jgi:hypothetical protein
MVKERQFFVNRLNNWLISKFLKTHNCDKKSLKIFISLEISSYYSLRFMWVSSNHGYDSDKK